MNLGDFVSRPDQLHRWTENIPHRSEEGGRGSSQTRYSTSRQHELPKAVLFFRKGLLA
jgi:hypothetical protein